MCAHAAIGEQLLLLRRAHPVLRVGDDRHAGRFCAIQAAARNFFSSSVITGASVATLMAPDLMPVVPMPWVISRMYSSTISSTVRARQYGGSP